MTPERRRQAFEVFDAALQREPNERTSFVAEVCAHDDDLCAWGRFGRRVDGRSWMRHESAAGTMALAGRAMVTPPRFRTPVRYEMPKKAAMRSRTTGESR